LIVKICSLTHDDVSFGRVQHSHRFATRSQTNRRMDDLLGPSHVRLLTSPPKPDNSKANGPRRGAAARRS
jgi:hypothetical protein